MYLRMLNVKDVAIQWGSIEPMVAEALTHGDGNVQAHDLLLSCLSSNGQCWVLCNDDNVIEGCGISQFINHSQEKELYLVAAHGKGWYGTHGREILETVEEFARQSNCKTVSLLGRKGWARALPEEYYTPYHVYTRRL